MAKPVEADLKFSRTTFNLQQTGEHGKWNQSALLGSTQRSSAPNML